MRNFGTVELNGKVYTLTSDAQHTNRVLGCMDFHEANEGEEYKFEMSASAIDSDGNKYIVYWIFTDVKGEEMELDEYDYDDVDRIEEI